MEKKSNLINVNLKSTMKTHYQDNFIEIDWKDIVRFGIEINYSEWLISKIVSY